MSRVSEAEFSSKSSGRPEMSKSAMRKARGAMSGVRTCFKIKEGEEDKAKLSLLKKVSDHLQDCTTKNTELKTLLKDAYDKVDDCVKEKVRQNEHSEALLKVCNEYTEDVTRKAKQRIDKYIMEHEEKLLNYEIRSREEAKINELLREENNKLASQIATLREHVVPKAAFDQEIKNCKEYVAKAEKHRDELKAEIARLSALAGSTVPKAWTVPFSFPTAGSSSSRVSQGVPPGFSPSPRFGAGLGPGVGGLGGRPGSGSASSESRKRSRASLGGGMLAPAPVDLALLPKVSGRRPSSPPRLSKKDLERRHTLGQ